MNEARVALIARPGAVRERLQSALHDAGAQLALVADPDDAQPAQVIDAGVGTVVFALDPTAESALDRLGPVLDDPAITLILEEADQIVRRDGWDAARWVRHLSAKLGLRSDVLPPVAGAHVQAVADETSDDLAWAGQPLAKRALAEQAQAHAHADEASQTDAAHEQPQTGVVDWEAMALEWSNSIGNEVAAPADLATHVHDAGFDAADHVPAPTLADNDPAAAALRADDADSRSRFERDLDALQQRIAGMSLEEEPVAAPARVPGWVLLLAGTGGPDAVRQLLAALPAGFPRPVLVRQVLPGQAAYDKLVRQMQRITPLTVELAQLDAAPQPGHVYVLPQNVVLAAGTDGAVFQPGDDDLAGLPSGDAAVVALSGSDPAIADALMAHAWNGAVVLAQALEGCYAPAASEALTARGVDAVAPAELAKRLADRWPA